MHNQSHFGKDLTHGISNEFKNFLSDVEDLVKQATELTGEELTRAHEKLNARISAAKESVSHVGAAVSERARSAAHATNEYVHEQPWKVISIGAAFGLLLGFVLARRG
jgi:ElaB/YqjD/DUF883 family membrane-anchored ribosome-binding protein